MSTYKLIVAGGRDFTDYQYLLDVLSDHLSCSGDRLEIVSGGARGADHLGEMFAKANGLKLTVFKADWAVLGKAAGHIRNAQMADYADGLIAFWDGESRGTKNMIDTATKKGLVVEVFKYE